MKPDLGHRPGFEWEHSLSPQEDPRTGRRQIYVREIKRVVSSGHVCMGGYWVDAAPRPDFRPQSYVRGEE